MNENNKTLSSDFEAVIMEKLKKLQNYYNLNGYSNNGFKEAYSEAEALLKKLPESQNKQSALAELYMSSYWFSEKCDELKEKIISTAKNGNNADVMCQLLIGDIIENNGENNLAMVKRIDEEALPQMEKMNSPHNKGILLFWRGAAKLRLKELNEALNNFEAAVCLIKHEDVYHANAVAALNSIERMNKNADDPYTGFYAMGESFVERDGKLLYIREPGFNISSVMKKLHRLDAVFYYVSRCDGMFYDTSMKVGDTHKSRDGKSSLTLAALDETVTVSAGTFTCMRVHYSFPAEYDADVWYSDGVGLIKAEFRGNSGNEDYELAEYEIKGGKGFMPACKGNRWRYIKPDLPDYLYQCYEREVDWTDGKTINFSVLKLVAYKKNYLDEYELDSDICIKRCDVLCDEWRIDEAIDMLRLAIRKNSTQNATATALAGINYLTRFKEYNDKGYRFCPSSMHGSYLTVSDGSVVYKEAGAYSFSPYRFGTRHEENRIFGVKPFRFLQDLVGRIYDGKWMPGYMEEVRPSCDANVLTRLTVTEAGTVAVKAGTFDNCIKVTITAEYDTLGENYYFRDFKYTHCGTKEFWFASGVGIVKFDFIWGTTLKSSSELVTYTNPAAGSEYMPVYIGSGWEYDEVNLTSEGYRAKRIINVACGMDGKYIITDAQEFVYLGTEVEYEAFKVNLAKK